MTTSELAPFSADQDSIARYLGLNPKDPKSHAVMAVCDRYKLDPILKHVIVLPQGGVYITRDGLLHVAHMSGQLDGIVLEAQGETDAEWWAEVSIYRKDMRFPFKFRGRYSKAAKNKAYGPEMALKCAEALALRRAFDVSGLPVLEERDAAPQNAPKRVDTARLTPPKPTVQHVETAAETAESEPVDTETGEILDAEVVDDEPETLEIVPESDDSEPESDTKQPLTADQSHRITVALKALELGKVDGLALYSEVCGRPVKATRDLSRTEAGLVLAHLETMTNG